MSVQVPLEEVDVCDLACCNTAYIQVTQSNANQRNPGKLWMMWIQSRNKCPCLVTEWVLAEVLQATTNSVTAGVAGQRVQPKEGCVCYENQSSNAHSKSAIFSVESQDCVISQDHVEDKSSKEEVTM